MSRGRRLLLMAVAIFCLLIFSVTGPMTDTFGSWFFSGGEGAYATMKLPNGKQADISIEEYRTAVQIQEFEGRLFGTRADKSEEEVLFRAALDKLATAYEVVVTAQELREILLGFTRGVEANYANLYRSMGYKRPVDFEAMLSRVLRLQKMQQMLASAAIVTEEDVIREWQDLYREVQYSYAFWTAAEFADAAAELEPTEAELATFFAEKLTPLQRLDLEREEAARFELLVVTAEAAAGEGVQRLIGSDFEPSEAALEEFYNSRSLSLYRRPLPEGELKLPQDQSPVLSLEEVSDRLLRDFRIHAALKQSYLSLVGGTDAAAFAAEHGLLLKNYEEPVKLSEIENVEDYGAFQLRAVFSGTPGTWMDNPVLLPKELGFLMRPIEVQKREMPPLEEIRDAVVGHWREGEQQRLAQEAADEFIQSLPKPADWVDGDPTVIEAAPFSQALAAERRAQLQQDWIARTPRLAADPAGINDDPSQRRVRSLISGRLGDVVDGQVIGPEDFGADGIMVAHLAGRRDADDTQIWPAETARARSLAQQKASQAFQTDQLSFEGFAKAWELTKVLVTEPEN
ncbi:MAG: hypothetical protein O3A20_07285 [Planctomycetota bacterium]|nr:hypothetical protein [Planctomycetota bacterium]